MDNKIILELVAKNLEEIKLLVEALQNGEKADPLLIEITAIKAKTLYQELMLLSPDEVDTVEKEFVDEPEKTSIEESEIQGETPPETSYENEIFTSSEIENSAVEIDEITVIETETVINVSELSEDPDVSNEITPEPSESSELIKEVKQEKVIIEIHENIILEEQLKSEPSVYEILATSSSHESKVIAKPVTNIMNAIGINDRFLFTRELFGNDSKKFEETVNQIDQLKNILEAIDFLEKNFQWTKNEASLKFMELVKRRFEN